MVKRFPGPVIASCFGLSAFALALLTGMTTGLEVSEVLLRSIGALLVCVIAGRMIASAAEVAVREYVNAYRERRETELALPSESGRSQEPNEGTTPEAGAQGG